MEQMICLHEAWGQRNYPPRGQAWWQQGPCQAAVLEGVNGTEAAGRGASPERKTGKDSGQLRAPISPPCGFPHKVKPRKSKWLAQGHRHMYWQSWKHRPNPSLCLGLISLQSAFVKGKKLFLKKLLSLFYFWVLIDESISTPTLLCSTCFSSICTMKKKASFSHLHVT